MSVLMQEIVTLICELEKYNLSFCLVLLKDERLAAKQWAIMINLKIVGECVNWIIYYKYKKV